MPKNSKVVFFDIKNVLLYFCPDKMKKQIASYCQIEETLVEETLKSTGWGEQYERGEIDSMTLFHYLPPLIQGSKGFSGWFNAISSVFEPNDHITPIIKELKKNNVLLFAFSNICEAHFSYAYTHFPVLHLFDGYILSYETGVRKPDDKMYECALQKANAEKEDSFFVEGVEEYVQKARLLGLDSEFYISPKLLQSQLKDRGLLP